MTNEIVWFETAKSHLRIAKKNFKIGEYLTAFREAITCAEVALKSIMIKNGIFSKQDEHHRIPQLFTKIKTKKCLSANTIMQLENLIGDKSRGGLGYINILSPLGTHMDTTAGRHVNLRYPVGTSIPDEMVNTADAYEKITQAEKLINILSSFF